MASETTSHYSRTVPDALAYAAEAHSGQTRKGKSEPYLTHLMRAAMLALRWAPEEWRDEAVAGAALHDCIEDQGGEARRRDIERTFGPRVAEIVSACTDSTATDPTTKLPWNQRKREHLAKLQEIAKLRKASDRTVLLVTLCDKVSNLEDMLDDIESARAPLDETMSRFKGKVAGTWHYFRAMYRVTLAADVPEASEHFRALMERFTELANDDRLVIMSLDDVSQSPDVQFLSGLSAPHDYSDE